MNSTTKACIKNLITEYTRKDKQEQLATIADIIAAQRKGAFWLSNRTIEQIYSVRSRCPDVGYVDYLISGGRAVDEREVDIQRLARIRLLK